MPDPTIHTDPNMLPVDVYDNSSTGRFKRAYDRFYDSVSSAAQTRIIVFMLGVRVLWDYVCLVFLRAVTIDTVKEIRSSPTLRGMMTAGVIIIFLVLAHALKHDWPIIDCLFLIVQSYRLVMFMGTLEYEEKQKDSL